MTRTRGFGASSRARRAPVRPRRSPFEASESGRGGDDDRHVAVAGAGELAHVRGGRLRRIAPVRKDPKRYVEAELGPTMAEVLALYRIVLHVEGMGGARGDRFGVLERVDRLPIEVLDDHHRDRTGAWLSLERKEVEVELGVLACVHVVHPYQNPNHQRDEQHHRPCTIGELRDRDDHRHDRRRDRAQAVDYQTMSPSRLT